MRVVGGAVQRIEDPARPIRHAGCATHLLRQNLMIGKALGDERPEHPLDRHVDFGDEIDHTLLVDANVLAELRHLHFTGAQNGFDCCGEKKRVGQRRTTNVV